LTSVSGMESKQLFHCNGCQHCHSCFSLQIVLFSISQKLFLSLVPSLTLSPSFLLIHTHTHTRTHTKIHITVTKTHTIILSGFFFTKNNTHTHTHTYIIRTHIAKV